MDTSTHIASQLAEEEMADDDEHVLLILLIPLLGAEIYRQARAH
jgi:hypothetical protein